MAIVFQPDARCHQFAFGPHKFYWRYERKDENVIDGDYDTEWGVGLFMYNAAISGYEMIAAINDYPVGSIPNGGTQAEPIVYAQTLEGKRQRLVDQMIHHGNQALIQRNLNPPTNTPTGDLVLSNPDRKATNDYIGTGVIEDTSTWRLRKP